MKKLLFALVVLIALGAAGVTVYHLQNAAHGGESATVASCLPADTLLLFSLPDPGQTAADWKTTDLYKIWKEPEVQAFLEKPLSHVPANNPQFNDARDRISKLQPKNLFIALTALDEKSNQPHLVAGFEFSGSKADVDALLAEPKNQLRQHFPGGKANLINYQGHSVETFDTGDGNTLASVYLDNQYLVANDLALLQSTVDRLEHRTPASGQSTLDKDADFQAVLGKLPSVHATLIFGRMQPFITRIYALAAASGQPIDETQRVEAEKLRAIGATTGIEHGKLRDTIYCFAPGHVALPATLQMSALPLASADTLFYAAGVFNLPKQFSLPSSAPGAAGLGALKDLAAMLEAHGLTFAQFQAAFGNEPALQLDWPANSAQPKLIASLDVRDHALASKFVDNLTNALAAEAAWQTAQADGLSFHTLASPGISFVNPTLTLTAKHLIFGLNPPEVHDAAKRENAPVPNFTQGEAYKTALSQVEKPNLAFAYLDSHAFFERFYGALKPLAMFGTALIAPQAGDYVDLGKLPGTEAISKHLSPAVLSESSDDKGVLLESVGSFTYGQGAAVLAGVSAAVAIPMIEKQYGSLPGMPGSKPSATPQPGPGE